ncbi:MAG: hypothetical protein VXZ38_09110 [Planctomycetota bacterium]|nr:hypothetical protein [Planctomycetota bacterium]
MSLIITCEVGGNAIPPWLGPHLAQIGQQKKRNSKSRKKKSKREIASKRSEKISSRSALPSNRENETHPQPGALPKALHADRNTIGNQATKADLPTPVKVTSNSQTMSHSAPDSKRRLVTPQGNLEITEGWQLQKNLNHNESQKTISLVPERVESTLEQLEIDPFALEITHKIASSLDASVIHHRYPLEMVDVTKDLNQRRLFGGPFQRLQKSAQNRLLEEVHQSYFEDLSSVIESKLKSDGFVIHFSVRTFPLKSKGTVRRTDVGFLYDPSRQDEVDLCSDLADDIWYRAPMLKVRRNYPRRGSEVGITRRLRNRFSGSDYLGIELWLNRAWTGRAVSLREEALRAMIQSMASVTGVSEHPLDYDDFYDDAA